MKKIVICFLVFWVLFTSVGLRAQRYLGIVNSEYCGVYGSQYNPSKLISDRVKFSFNLIGVGVTANNYDHKFESDRNFLNMNYFNSTQDIQDITGVVINAEVLLPSFQFTWGDKLGFGFGNRARVFLQGNSSREIGNKLDIEEILSGKVNVISDVGVSGAYKLVDNDNYNLTLGLGLKVYRGVYFEFESDGEYIANSQVLSSLSKGVGGDFGGELLLKSSISSDRPYKAKLGLAFHDLGRMKYSKVDYINISKFGIVDSGKLRALQSANKSTDYLQSKQFNMDYATVSSKAMVLPLGLNAYVDVPLSKIFYVSTNTHISLANTKDLNSFYHNTVSLVPRFETRWFDAALPLTYNFNSNDIKYGLSLRMGPLTVGSDGIGALFTDAKDANVYIGLGFPISKNSKKEVNRN